MKLHVTEADGGERTVILSGKTVRIGRQSDNEITLDDLFVSRHHAELRETPSGWEIRDTGSKSGTFVNERAVRTALLRPGDEMRLGRCILRLEDTRGDETVIAVSDRIPGEATVHSLRVTDAPEAGLTRVLVDAARQIVSPESSRAILHKLLGLALRATGAERGAIAIFASGGALETRATAGRWPDEQVAISRQVLGRVKEQGEAVIVEDIPGDASLKDAGTIVRAGVRSVLCTPLGPGQPPRGILYLDTLSGRATFQPSHLEVVTILAGMADLALENEAARQAQEARRAFEAQLAAAKEIQDRLLPPAVPEAPEGFTVAGHHESCLTVGGDFFDFFECRTGYGMVLADVAGKGLSAALLMANFHAVWHHLRSSETPVEDWLPTLNEELLSYLPDNRFITLAFAIASRSEGKLIFGSAGHNAALLWSGGELEELPATGAVLGLMDRMPFDLTERPFRPGDCLVLYSDGVTDQQSPDGEPFGQARLNECVLRHGGAGARKLLEKIQEALGRNADGASQDDDITISILTCR
ncbi:MAG: SpoIIE family protein phosphatase [Acidobacteriota bacterium]